MASWSTTRWALLWVALFGLVWAHAIGLTQFADPTAIDWMIEGDWLGHLFGWLFVRNGPWALPLAQAPDLVFPAGSSAALTDAIPLLSVIGKILSPFFGERMQLFGLWMVLGIIGTGVVGVLVCRPWLHDAMSLTLAGFLFVMNPVVTARFGHPPFFAFWVVTGLIGLCLWPITSTQTARRVAAITLALGAFACATNAYLAVMCSVVMGASMLRVALHRQLKIGEMLVWLVSAPVLSVVMLWAFGFVSGARSAPASSLSGEGFGEFSADALTFINSMGWSRIIPGMATRQRQGEGFGYLGLGVLALLVLRLFLVRRQVPSKRWWVTFSPVLVLLAVMFFYALSNTVTVAGKQIAHFGFYDSLAPLPSIFRSSGRFIWPLYALLTMVAVLAVRGFSSIGFRHLALVLACALQLVDVNPLVAPIRHPWPQFQPFRDPAWQLMKQGYQHVAIHPVQIQWTCPFDGKLVAQLSWEAYRQHLTINSGHVGRAPVGTDCHARFDASKVDPNTIYLPYFKEYLPDFQVPAMICGPVEGRTVCVARDHQTPLRDELLRRVGAN